MNQVDELLQQANKLYQPGMIPYSWVEVTHLVNRDPEYFRLALKKAANPQYRRSERPNGTPVLWIACNLVTAKLVSPCCYYCGRQLQETEFYSGGVHLEHYQPRSSNGKHQPYNIIHSCKKCDTLKGPLTPEEMLHLWRGDLTVRELRPKCSNLETTQLMEFADVVAPHSVGLAEYGIHHGVGLREVRGFWEMQRRLFREKWHWS